MLEYTSRSLLAKDSLPENASNAADSLINEIESGKHDQTPQILMETGTGAIYYASKIVDEQYLTVFYRKKDALAQEGVLIVDILYGSKE